VIALDTNVLARAILQDDELQSPRAAKAIESLAAGEGALITMSVILELAWVLRKRKHRAEIYETLHHLLESEGITFVGAAIVGDALEIYRQGKVDFGDAVLLAEASAHGVVKVTSFNDVLLKSDRRCVPVG
jgi:predicted nucleic-acid-binding protein